MTSKTLFLLSIIFLSSCAQRHYGHLTVKSQPGERTVSHHQRHLEAKHVAELETIISPKQLTVLPYSPDARPMAMKHLQIDREIKVPKVLISTPQKEQISGERDVRSSSPMMRSTEPERESNYGNFMGILFGIVLIGLVIYGLAYAATSLGWSVLAIIGVILLVIGLGVLMGYGLAQL